MLGIPAQLAIDGAILWGAGADVANRTRCEIFGEYVARTLGPCVAKWVNGTSVRRLPARSSAPLKLDDGGAMACPAKTACLPDAKGCKPCVKFCCERLLPVFCDPAQSIAARASNIV